MLHDAVSEFAAILYDKSDDDLNRPWAWQSYRFEGVRFAFFRTYEELKALALALYSQRIEANRQPTAALYILSHYHAAFRDLEATLFGLSDDDADQVPAPDEWSVRDALSHIVQADVGFYLICRHALERYRHGDSAPEPISAEEREQLLGIGETEFELLLASPLTELRAYHTIHHERVLSAFANIDPAELAIPSIFWEEEAYPLQFRLFRFDSHMRQHTVQITKTLIAIGRDPTEAQRLLHLIYAALAEVEMLTIDFEEAAGPMLAEAATVVLARTEELRAVLGATED